MAQESLESYTSAMAESAYEAFTWLVCDLAVNGFGKGDSEKTYLNRMKAFESGRLSAAFSRFMHLDSRVLELCCGPERINFNGVRLRTAYTAQSLAKESMRRTPDSILWHYKKSDRVYKSGKKFRHPSFTLLNPKLYAKAASCDWLNRPEASLEAVLGRRPS